MQSAVEAFLFLKYFMQMKLIVTLFLLFSSLFPLEHSTDKIGWSESERLSWADFQGRPTKGAGYVASTSSGISFSYSYKLKDEEVTYNYTVESFFYPKESWYKPELVSAYILDHEQTHFDISELHSRVLRKMISEASFSKNIKKEIEALYQEVEKQRRIMQDRFDLETEHSKISEKEIQWETFIATQLKAYERWK